MEAGQITDKYQPFRLSPEAFMLMEELKAAEVGQVLTYDELKSKRGIDYQERRYLIITAKRRLMKEGIHIGTVHGVGLKRLNQPEAVDHLHGRRESRIRGLKKDAQWSVTIDTSQLNQEERTSLDLERARIGVSLFVCNADEKKLLPAGRENDVLKIIKKLAESNK